MNETNKKIKTVAVYCGHQFGNNPEYADDAKLVGELLAKNNMTLVFGGGNVGLMGTVASAVIENNGKAIGISTKHVASLQEPAHKDIDVKIVDGLSARKEEMFELADAFVILPGGIGTLDEMTDIMTKHQVKESCKPIYILNTANYWEKFDAFLAFMRSEGFVPNPCTYNICVVNTPEELIEKLLKGNDFIATC